MLPSTLVTAVDGTSTEPVALLHVANGERGAYLGVYVDPGGEDGIFNVWLSPDKTFVFGKGRSREAPSALEHNVYFLWTRDPP